MSRLPDLDEFLEDDDDIEFPGDDWEYGYVAGKEAERERIIKLLEEVLQFDSEDEKRNLFALITGEQK